MRRSSGDSASAPTCVGGAHRRALDWAHATPSSQVPPRSPQSSGSAWRVKNRSLDGPPAGTSPANDLTTVPDCFRAPFDGTAAAFRKSSRPKQSLLSVPSAFPRGVGRSRLLAIIEPVSGRPEPTCKRPGLQCGPGRIGSLLAFRPDRPGPTRPDNKRRSHARHISWGPIAGCSGTR